MEVLRLRPPIGNNKMEYGTYYRDQCDNGWTGQLSKNLHLRSLLETTKDADEIANILVNRVRKAQRTATASQLIQTLCRGDLPLHLREKMQQKRRIHKLWTRTCCPRLNKKLNELVRKLAIAVRYHRGAA
ncbi:hypothetical protein EVAR_49526_1 [Eumeta japonica]|uniref:Uncharacterized protein n=1 Tax=Eumeta variegata TaxID=151549 RepID=A0A4C1XJY1_EUMVA|nr:hypothetical protein EVAR_49526_1 [Eumeta japonica]